MINRQTVFSLVLATLVLSGGLAGMATAAGNSEINYDEGPDVLIYEDSVGISTHNMSEMSDIKQYYDDNGNVKTLPATLNESIEDNVAVTYTHISDDDLAEFPRDGTERPVDAADWSKDVSGSAGTATISDSMSAENVDAVTLSTSSQTAGDVAKFTYGTNVSITSDANKRVMFVPFNVDTLDSGANVEIRAVDDDGDYVAATVDSSASTDSSDVAATATGDGYVFQMPVSDLSTQGSGDGNIDSINSLEVVVSDGDAALELTGADLEKKSTVDLGKTLRDTDGDGEEEETTFTEVDSAGEVRLLGLDTLPEMFDDAEIQGLTVFGVEYRASEVTADDVSYNFTEASNYPGYASKLDAYQRIVVPTAIDLSHSNLEFKVEQKFISERYKVAEVAEGTGDTDFSNISSWSDVSGSYSGVGNDVVLDSTIQPGQSYVWHGELVLQDDEVRDMQDTASVAGPVDNGGLGAKVWGAIAAAIALLTGGMVRLGGE